MTTVRSEKPRQFSTGTREPPVAIRDRQYIIIDVTFSMTSVEGSTRPTKWVESEYRISTALGSTYLKDVQHIRKVQIKPLEMLSKTRLYIDNHQNSSLKRKIFPFNKDLWSGEEQGWSPMDDVSLDDRAS